MKKDLDDALCRDFPLTFRNRALGARESCMGRGFEVEDGWEPLIRRAAAKIEPILATYAPDTRPTTSQIKEKFGVLRWYWTSEDGLGLLARAAEVESRTTCEACGAPGALATTEGLMAVRCEPCREALAKTRRERRERWRTP